MGFEIDARQVEVVFTHILLIDFPTTATLLSTNNKLLK